MNDSRHSTPLYEGAGYYKDKYSGKWKYFSSMCFCPCHKAVDEYDQCTICDNSYADLCSPVLALIADPVYDESNVPLKFREWD